jgi:hypothetical protein
MIRRLIPVMLLLGAVTLVPASAAADACWPGESKWYEVCRECWRPDVCKPCRGVKADPCAPAPVACKPRCKTRTCAPCAGPNTPWLRAW